MSVLSRGLAPLSRRLIQPLAAGRTLNARSRLLQTRLHIQPLSTLPDVPLFRALKDHDASRLAVVHSASSRSFTYGNLVADVLQAKERLLDAAGSRDGVSGERIAFLAENSYDYVGTVHWILVASWIPPNRCSDNAVDFGEQCHRSSAFACLSHQRAQVRHGQFAG